MFSLQVSHNGTSKRALEPKSGKSARGLKNFFFVIEISAMLVEGSMSASSHLPSKLHISLLIAISMNETSHLRTEWNPRFWRKILVGPSNVSSMNGLAVYGKTVSVDTRSSLDFIGFPPPVSQPASYIMIKMVHHWWILLNETIIYPNARMDFKEELNFLTKLGLCVNVFGKEPKKSLHGYTDHRMFLIVTKSNGDELYHPNNLPEPGMGRLRNWIRCGDPTGLLPEWKIVDISGYNAKVYLAGQDLGIDCTSVIDEMFAEEGGEKYTYAYCRPARRLKKIKHPQEHLLLC